MQTEDNLIPKAEIPDGYNTRQILNFNYRYWSDCFNERQLYALSTLIKGILGLPPEVSDKNTKEFLILLLSSCLEFNNMFCSFKGRGTGAVRHMFSHHVLSPEKVPLENNLWGTPESSGSFSTLYYSKLRKAKEWCLRPVERIINGGKEKELIAPPLDKPIEARFAHSWVELVNTDANAIVRCASSTSLVYIPDQQVDAVITDPPYFDNVNYSELADFFYAWLGLVLKDYPEFQGENTRHEEEAIVNLTQGKTPDFYQDMLFRVFREAHRVLKDEGALVFTFHHATDDAWIRVFKAIQDAGFYCAAAWPIQGEMSVGVPLLGKKNAIEHDMILVCRKWPPPNLSFSRWDQVFTRILVETDSLSQRTL
ncbi:MAG: hypothetical protein M1379_03290 [Firmicutes bacterium]|nr:hypothetical protein [Bacillota bacterium]